MELERNLLMFARKMSIFAWSCRSIFPARSMTAACLSFRASSDWLGLLLVAARGWGEELGGGLAERAGPGCGDGVVVVGLGAAKGAASGGKAAVFPGTTLVCCAVPPAGNGGGRGGGASTCAGRGAFAGGLAKAGSVSCPPNALVALDCALCTAICLWYAISALLICCSVRIGCSGASCCPLPPSPRPRPRRPRSRAC